MKKRISAVIIFLLITAVVSLWILDEFAAQIISIAVIIITGALVLSRYLEKPGARHIILMAAPLFSSLLKYFSEMKFVNDLTVFYNKILLFVSDRLGVTSDFKLGTQSTLLVTFWVVFVIIFITTEVSRKYIFKNGTSLDSSIYNKNYFKKASSFKKVLRQRLERINTKTDWNEDLFTPLDAEIEACIKGKRKKKYDDLIKCLKKNKKNNTVFLVLGDPGSGKSVALRKLCLELLDDSKEKEQITVYIDLKKWTENWNINNLPQRGDLINFIKNNLYEEGDIFTDEFLNDYFAHMLEDGLWYFVFDSFDELPCLMGRQSCRQLIDHISNLLYEFLTGPNQKGGVIASRLYKSPSDSLRATVTLKIQEFSDIKIKTMIQKYLNRSNDVVKELFGKREDLIVLCRNPFYLSLLINYVRNNGIKFPKNQMDLYRDFINSRLDKCSEKIHTENISYEKVLTGARQLAVHMQQSTAYGLECPVAELFETKDEAFWKSVLEILKYAKICRYGGENGTISFVHRRFQEYFLVDNIIVQNGSIGRDEYECITSNSGIRDALVLYCEIADEQDAKDIADFCWSVVENNINQNDSIHNKGCIDLVNTLYFMSEAFRNRKKALEDFASDMYKLIKQNLNDKTDFIVLHALTNCMVLFDQKHIQKIALSIFKLKNRWLSDIVASNCRVLKKLDFYVEREFCKYFRQMKIKLFLERFRNTQFSLSLSKNFRYIRIVHFFRLLIRICFILTIVASFVLLISNINFDTIGIQSETKEHISLFEQSSENMISLDKLSIRNIVLLLFGLLMFPIGLLEYRRDFSDLFLTITAISSGYMVLEQGTLIGYIWMSVIISIILANNLIQVFHNLNYILTKQNKKRIFSIIKRKALETVVLIAASIVVLFIIYLLMKIKPIIIILSILSILSLIFMILECLYNRTKDRHWVKNQTIVTTLTRKKLARNLKELKTQKWKCKYIDLLLQNKVELTGQWPSGVRPYFTNDELVLKIARLDSMKIPNLQHNF